MCNRASQAVLSSKKKQKQEQKNPPQCRRLKRRRFNPWVGKVPWRRAWQFTPVFLPGESHGQRSLVDHSPYRHQESDTTKATEHAVCNNFTCTVVFAESPWNIPLYKDTPLNNQLEQVTSTYTTKWSRKYFTHIEIYKTITCELEFCDHQQLKLHHITVCVSNSFPSFWMFVQHD